MQYFLCSLSEILETEDVNVNNQQEQATVLGRMRRLLSVQEPTDLHTRPSFKRHNSDTSSFLLFGPDRHFHPRLEENLQTHSKLNFTPHFSPLSTVNEVNSTAPSPEASRHTPFPQNIPSVVVGEVPEGDDSDSDGDGVVEERTGPSEVSSLESAQVQEHCDKYGGGERQSSTNTANSFPSPKYIFGRKDQLVNQQQETLQYDSTLPQQTTETRDSSSQETELRRNQDS